MRGDALKTTHGLIVQFTFFLVFPRKFTETNINTTYYICTMIMTIANERQELVNMEQWQRRISSWLRRPSANHLRGQDTHAHAAKRLIGGRNACAKKKRGHVKKKKQKDAKWTIRDSHCGIIVLPSSERSTTPRSHPLPTHKSQMGICSFWRIQIVGFSHFSQTSSRGAQTPPAPR